MVSEVKATRLSKIASEFNVGISTIVDFLKKKGHDIDANPNTKVAPELYALLSKEYRSDISAKKDAERVNLRTLREKKETIEITEYDAPQVIEEEDEPQVLIKDTSLGQKTPLFGEPTRSLEFKVVGKIDLNEKPKKQESKPQPSVQEKPEKKEEPQPKKEQPKPKPKPQPVAEIRPDDTPGQPDPVEEKPVEKQPEPEVVIEEKKPVEETPVQEPEMPKDNEGEVEVEVERLVEAETLDDLKVVGKIDLTALNQRTRPKKKSRQQLERERKERTQQYKAAEKTPAEPSPQSQSQQGKEDLSLVKKLDIARPDIKLSGPTVVGKIDLPANKSSDDDAKKKRKRIHKDVKERIVVDKANPKKFDQGKTKKKKILRTEVNEDDVQKQIKETLSRLTSKSAKSKSSKYRRDKRDAASQRLQEKEELQKSLKNILKVTEFVSVNELASMMNVPVTQVIGTCMNMGLFVSINQRLDAETMVLVADEFNYKVEFISADSQDLLVEEEDDEDDLQPRPPIVTVMGHVDHGKTKLLDYIRNANVISGEAGGITQHIGAYSVKLDDDRRITFLDTPGHEAFTAMRARGAKITDVVIVVVAADDGVKQQTVEAINHASAAGVPIVFAINKIDKPEANPDRVKEELAQMNYLVEDWGGKYQSQEISAKAGSNIELLLEKVLLEAELLELKANPDRKAVGSVIESSLDKGRGYVATILVQNGTLHTGDVVLAGSYTGHVKAMYNERNQKIDEAGPSAPVLILGLDGAPQAGDLFNVMDDFREARDIASKRSQLQREQGMRTKKHITLDEIGRRIAIGNFQELDVIVKGDVDGSVEALSDSLIKLSTPEIQVNVIHKAVGQISESDVTLAAASNAVIVGFQVRPSQGARRLAEQEQIDIRIYSIIYDAIEEIKSAMEGMLSPEIKEEITATLEIREVFKISKVGTVAGCIVREGKIVRTSRIRIIRDGIVIHTGELGSLKRFKDDVKEVATGYECGLDVAGFNDIEIGDIIEGYQEVEVKKKL
ncbi:MAG: translation initiation factor IF-2 [Bacteroidales bacterium]|jgi:translation initiation factor IF-2|nr:translation initiation factor IF-2 [Bacteroidales bacterium]